MGNRGGRFGYVLFFFLLGGGEGGVRGAGGGGSVFIENIREGGWSPRRGGGGALRAGRVFAGNRRRLNLFLSGPKFPPSKANKSLEVFLVPRFEICE